MPSCRRSPRARPIDLGPEPPADPTTVARGAERYRLLGCPVCHGDEGRGDGVAAPQLRASDGSRVVPADLTRPWAFGGGGTARDVTTPLATGMGGTPMPGYLDVANAEPRLRDAVEIWLRDNIEVYEGGSRVGPLEIVAVRASIPSDRSFDDYATARAHLRGPPIPPGTPLVWQQALLDVELEGSIRSDSSLFSLRLKLERLGLRVVNAVRFQ